MIIKCPQCTATYDVPSAAAVQGRKVRCTRCAHVWRAEVMEGDAGAPVAAPPPAAAPITAAVPKTQALGTPVAAPVAVPAAAAPVVAAMEPRPVPAPVAPPAPAAAAPDDDVEYDDAPPPPAPVRSELRVEPRHEPKVRTEARAPLRAEPRPEPRPELRAEPRPESKPEAPALPRAERPASPPPLTAVRGGRELAPVEPPELRVPPPAAERQNGARRDSRPADAWDQVESSLNKVTNTTRQKAKPETSRTEQRPPLDQDVQPPRAQARADRRKDDWQEVPRSRRSAGLAEDDWSAAAAARPAQGQGNRPELDDEEFWRDRAAPADPSWPNDPSSDAGFIEEAAALPARGKGGFIVTLGWLMFAAIVAGLITFLFVGRTSVVAALPGAAPLYAKAGMPVNIRGLVFKDIAYKWGLDRRGRPAMTISGKVLNISQTPQTVPSVAFVFLDDQQAELFNWATRIREKPLDPGKTTSFEARIPAPPEAVANLQVRFAKGK